MLSPEARQHQRAHKLERRAAKLRDWRPRADIAAVCDRWQARPEGLPLDQYAERLTSQRGEDGMTFEVFRRIGVEHRRAIEIGCGTNGGNAGILVSALGWDALLIDGEQRLVDHCAGFFPESCTVTAWIDRESIGALLAEYDFGDRIDYLGIDLDGNDYWIWDALPLQPRLVIVEFNPLFGPDEAVTIEYRRDFSRKARDEAGQLVFPKGYYGASIAALTALAERKGYRLVGSAPQSGNAFFVRQDLAGAFPACTPSEAWRPPKPGKGRDQLSADIPAEGGVRQYFAARGFPVVDVSR